MTVLIVNPMNDPHCRHMSLRLEEMGIPYRELGCPIENDYAWSDGVLYYDGEPLQEVSAVFFRSVMTHDPTQLSTKGSQQQYTNQIQFSARAEAIREWLRMLDARGIPVINAPTPTSKYYQLDALQRAGVPIPRTCITSSQAAAKQFVERVGGQAIYKPLPGGSFCRKVDEAFWKDEYNNFAEPVIFQQFVPGVDVRVNMLEGAVLSAHHIITSRDDVLDYRTDPQYKDGAITYKPIQLPEHVIAYCDQAMRCLGLRFSGIDLRMTSDNQFTLIECNSMPAYLDIEMKTGTPITDLLIAGMMNHQPVNLPKGQEQERLGFVNEHRERVASPLFPYYDVMKEWSEQMTIQKNCVILPLNDQQQEEFRLQTGVTAHRMEVVRHGQELVVSRVW